MQYVWNLVSWFRCSTSVPPVNPGDAPTEPPKESKTLTGWKAWAAGTKRKEIPEEAKAVIAAIEEAKAATVEETKPEPVAEASTTAPAEEATKAPVDTPAVEEAKPEPVAESAPTVEESAVVPTTLETIPEESKELVSEDKKKVEEKGADEAKDLGSEFTSSS